jgi:hypothetical protein
MPVQVPKCSPNDYELDYDKFKCESCDYIPDTDYLSNVGDCNFYNELEKEKKCGSNGYLIKYGLKYCKKFGENINDFNADVSVLALKVLE